MNSLFSRKLPVLFQQIKPDQSSKCAELHAESFASAWRESDMEALICDPAIRADCVINSKTKAIFGFVISKLVLDEAELLTLLIQRKYQNFGIGKVLLSIHISALTNMSVRRIYLEVADDNMPALELYRKLGFVQIGIRNSYYAQTDGTRKAALTMRLEIH